MTVSMGSLRQRLRESEARKMLAKGFKVKVLLKGKPPQYARDMDGAKDIQKRYPGSKIVKNESVGLEEASTKNLYGMLPWAHDEEFVGAGY